MTDPQTKPPDAAPQPAGAGLVPPEQLPNRLFVRAAILAAVVGTALMIGLIGWRWYHVRFPDTYVLVRGDASAGDALVVVTDEDGRMIASGRLRPENEYRMVVLVEQGVFTVRADRDGRSLLATKLHVRTGGGGVLIEVKADGPNGPATRPATGQGGQAAAPPVSEPSPPPAPSRPPPAPVD